MEISELFNLYRKEKSSQKLCPLREAFYKRIAEQIKRYRRLLEISKEESEEVRKLRLELENLKDIIRELFFMRLEKMLKLLLFEIRENVPVAEKSDLSNEEVVLYEILSTILKEYKEKFLDKVLLGEYPDIQAFYEAIRKPLEKKIRVPKKVLLRFTNEMSQFIGPDMKTYGPFSPEDICSLDKEIAERLIELGVCEKVNIER